MPADRPYSWRRFVAASMTERLCSLPPRPRLMRVSPWPASTPRQRARAGFPLPMLGLSACRANVLVPGAISTEFRDFMSEEFRAKFEADVAGRTALRRAGSPDEAVDDIADALVMELERHLGDHQQQMSFASPTGTKRIRRRPAPRRPGRCKGQASIVRRHRQELSRAEPSQ